MERILLLWMSIVVTTFTSVSASSGLDCYECKQMDTPMGMLHGGCSQQRQANCNKTCFEVQIFADLKAERFPGLSLIMKGCGQNQNDDECITDIDGIQKWFDEAEELKDYPAKVTTGKLCYCSNNLCNNKLTGTCLRPLSALVFSSLLFVTIRLGIIYN